MDYVEGSSLAELIRAASSRRRKIPVAIAARIVCDALAGLHAAHQLTDADGSALHLIHRDVSPQNLLVGADGVTRLSDFGIAKADVRGVVTREGQSKGKVGYVAPEQLLGKSFDLRVDVFAAGVVLWEALTGERLFAAQNEFAAMRDAVQGDIDPPSSRVADVPPALDTVVLRALAADPADRYANAREFAAAIDRCGITVAGHREVAEYVGSLLGASIAARRAQLREQLAAHSKRREDEPTDPVDAVPLTVALEHLPMPDDVPTRVEAAPDRTETSTAAIASRDTAASITPAPPSATPIAEIPSRSSSTVRAIAAALAIAAVASLTTWKLATAGGPSGGGSTAAAPPPLSASTVSPRPETARPPITTTPPATVPAPLRTEPTTVATVPPGEVDTRVDGRPPQDVHRRATSHRAPVHHVRSNASTRTNGAASANAAHHDGLREFRQE
jgi:serine/threonine-protein kinase